jgi:cobalt-zinc-cadmium efflux system membrane fusion protein
MRFDRAPRARGAASAIVAATLAGGALGALGLSGCSKTEAPEGPKTAPPTADKVELTDQQLTTVGLGAVAVHPFSPQRTAVGSIDFDEDRAVQVYSVYPGKIVQAFRQIGDEVRKGQPLYTIESTDLMSAASTLIAAAATYDMNTRALERARKLQGTKGISDQNVEQAQAAQVVSDAALKAARAAVRVFGKTEAEVDKMIAARRIDPDLVVPSPIAGRVTARNAQPGLLVQPGTAPAPYAVADLSTLWMLANVAENDAPLFRKGQPVRVKVMAFPDRDFAGQISVVGATIDPSVHTELVRADVRDPGHDLRPGMMATFVIGAGAAVSSPAMPPDGVVREGDGSMYVWTTTDDHHFTRRKVTIGIIQDGFDQIVDGLQPGERVVTKGALFLSNMANAAAGD